MVTVSHIIKYLMHLAGSYHMSYYLLIATVLFGAAFMLPFQEEAFHAQPKVSYNPIGDGPDLQCFLQFNLNIINDGVSFLLCHIGTLFDTYVGVTQNLFTDSSNIGKDYRDKLFTPMKRLALILMPVLYLVAIFFNIIEVIHLKSSESKVMRYIYSFVYNIILILITPQLFLFSIDLCNAISLYIIKLNSGISNTTSLSTSIMRSIQASETIQSQFIPAFAANFLWLGLLIAFLYIVIFFVIRFVLIWVIFLSIPILFAFDPIPVFATIRETIIIKLVQFVIVQPIFLLGVCFFLILMQEPLDGITKIILAICSLFTIGFIPSFIAGISGGKLANISEHHIQGIVHGAIGRVGIVLGWLEDAAEKPYTLPFDKPGKS